MSSGLEHIHMEQTYYQHKESQKIMKYFEKCNHNINKSQVKIGDKFGNLTVYSETYYKDPPKTKKHRRQHVDCKCDCGT